MFQPTARRLQIRRWRDALDAGSRSGARDRNFRSGDMFRRAADFVCRRMAYAAASVERVCSDRRAWWRALPFSGRRQDVGSLMRAGNGLPEGDWGRVGVDVAPDGKRVYALIEAAKSEMQEVRCQEIRPLSVGRWRQHMGPRECGSSSYESRMVLQSHHHRSAESRCDLHSECRSLPIGGRRKNNLGCARRARRR